MQRTGFTLAEVLITLAIIGVVAALTIPTVVLNYQKTQTVTRLKKTYSALANTTNLAIAEYGPITGWEVGADATGQAAVDFANKYLIPYLKVSKNCKNSIDGICQPAYKYLNGVSTTSFGSNWAKFYLNDGVLVGVGVRNYTYEGGDYRRGEIYIDVNGYKKPNIWGKDLFRFDYYIYNGSQNHSLNGRFVAHAFSTPISSLKTGEWGCHKDGKGTFCVALIIKQGWQITDDYPWN